MFEIGRLVMKIAGRDARKVAVVVDVLDNKMVLIDGQTRRRKTNVAHLEPLDKKIKIAKGASTQDVASALESAGFPVVLKKNSHPSAVRQPRLRGAKKKTAAPVVAKTKAPVAKKTTNDAAKAEPQAE